MGGLFSGGLEGLHALSGDEALKKEALPFERNKVSNESSCSFFPKTLNPKPLNPSCSPHLKTPAGKLASFGFGPKAVPLGL